MTVKELIQELQKIENQDLPVVVYDAFGELETADEVYQIKKYFSWKIDEKWIRKSHDCAFITF